MSTISASFEGPSMFADDPTSGASQNNEPVQFHFLGLPKEVQSKIIEWALILERSAFRPHLSPLGTPSATIPKIYDFNVSAFGMRSNTLPPFGLLFVNKEVSGDALAVVYQNSSFAIHAEICRDGVPTHAFGYIPNVVRYLSPMVKENAREVTFKISTISEGREHPVGNLTSANRRLVLKQAQGDLRILLNEATFPHVKTLNLVLNTQGFVQAHLNMIFKLFATTGCVITLEEVCNTLPATSQKAFGDMVAKAAEVWNQNWVTESRLDESSSQTRWHGHHNVSWGRYREWDRRFATGPILPPFKSLPRR